ncbi:MAG TPA: RNA polymerase sigma factor [Candidatus Kapabacteria bacterium]|jgi:RNA polymerase sigma-70 factor (ECF subfamily)|nr:RNA polymerase sigma factor [Candidatus Kapabacteria bacterium]
MRREISADEKERFVALLAPARHRLMHFARMMTQDYEEARDLVGETILQALEGFDRLRDDGAFVGYLFTIATRLHRRRRWRAKLFGAFDESTAASIADSAPPPDVAADAEALYRALGMLPERQRETLVLFELTGLSLKEIQAIQGGSLSGVKLRLHRGRKRLAVLLGVPDSSERFDEPGFPPTADQGTDHTMFLLARRPTNA